MEISEPLWIACSSVWQSTWYSFLHVSWLNHLLLQPVSFCCCPITMHFWEESGSVLSTQFPSSCCMWQCNPPLSLFSPGWKKSTPSASPCTSYAAALDYCDDPSLICPCLSCRGETKTGHSTPDTDLKCWIEWKDHFPRPWWCSPGCGSPSSQPGHTICSCSTCCPSLPSQYQASTVAWGYSTPYSGFAFCLVELQETYLSWNFWKAAVSHKTIDSMAEMSQLASILLHPAADITIILWRGGEISGHSPSERK